MPMQWSSCIEDSSFFWSLSSLLSVSVIVPWLSSLFRYTHTVAQVHSHLHVSCVRWALRLISSTSPFTSSPSSSSLWSPCCSYCPTPSTSLMSWINTLRTSAEDLGTLAEDVPPTLIVLYVTTTTAKRGVNSSEDDLKEIHRFSVRGHATLLRDVRVVHQKRYGHSAASLHKDDILSSRPQPQIPRQNPHRSWYVREDQFSRLHVQQHRVLGTLPTRKETTESVRSKPSDWHQRSGWSFHLWKW